VQLFSRLQRLLRRLQIPRNTNASKETAAGKPLTPRPHSGHWACSWRPTCLSLQRNTEHPFAQLLLDSFGSSSAALAAHLYKSITVELYIHLLCAHANPSFDRLSSNTKQCHIYRISGSALHEPPGGGNMSSASLHALCKSI